MRALESKRDIADAQDGHRTGQLGFDTFDGIERLDSSGIEVLLTGGDRKGQSIEDERVGGQAVLIDADIIDLMGNLDFTLGRLPHALFIDGQRDDCCTMLHRQWEDLFDALATILHIDRVDDDTTWCDFQRRLNDIRLGRVDHQRRIQAHRELLDQGRHLFGLVSTFSERDLHIQNVRAALSSVRGQWRARVS